MFRRKNRERERLNRIIESLEKNIESNPYAESIRLAEWMCNRGHAVVKRDDHYAKVTVDEHLEVFFKPLLAQTYEKSLVEAKEK